jgi:hypothetical protein
MNTPRRLTLTVAACATAVALAGCGGSGNVTLHGTFTDLNTSFTAGQPCQAQETQTDSNYHVTVAVDDIPAASVPVAWHDNAYAVDGTVACAGTWSASVKSAQVAYQIRMTGNDGFGFQGTDDVSPDQAGNVIALSNAAG